VNNNSGRNSRPDKEAILTFGGVMGLVIGLFTAFVMAQASKPMSSPSVIVQPSPEVVVITATPELPGNTGFPGLRPSGSSSTTTTTLVISGATEPQFIVAPTPTQTTLVVSGTTRPQLIVVPTPTPPPDPVTKQAQETITEKVFKEGINSIPVRFVEQEPSNSVIVLQVLRNPDRVVAITFPVSLAWDTRILGPAPQGNCVAPWEIRVGPKAKLLNKDFARIQQGDLLQLSGVARVQAAGSSIFLATEDSVVDVYGSDRTALATCQG
jgi:hypothetical protein